MRACRGGGAPCVWVRGAGGAAPRVPCGRARPSLQAAAGPAVPLKTTKINGQQVVKMVSKIQ